MLYLEICEELITIIRSDMIEKIVIMCKLILELCKFLKQHQAYYINRKTNFIAFFIQLLIFLTEERYNVFLIEVFDGLHKFTWSAQLYKSCFFFSSISCYTSMFYEKASALKPYSLCCCFFFQSQYSASIFQFPPAVQSSLSTDSFFFIYMCNEYPYMFILSLKWICDFSYSVHIFQVLNGSVIPQSCDSILTVIGTVCNYSTSHVPHYCQACEK